MGSTGTVGFLNRKGAYERSRRKQSSLLTRNCFVRDFQWRIRQQMGSERFGSFYADLSSGMMQPKRLTTFGYYVSVWNCWSACFVILHRCPRIQFHLHRPLMSTCIWWPLMRQVFLFLISDTGTTQPFRIMLVHPCHLEKCSSMNLAIYTAQTAYGWLARLPVPNHAKRGSECGCN